MKWTLILSLIATALFLSSCANPGQDMGKIGRDYDTDPTVTATRNQNMHSNIIRNNF
jgi:protein involved in sex pheromone biosynthesis